MKKELHLFYVPHPLLTDWETLKEWLYKRTILYPRIKHVLKQGMEIVKYMEIYGNILSKCPLNQKN